VYIGWVGDSQVTIWGNNKEKKANITTDAHKPDVPAEMFRIYDNRGEIRETADGKHRIFIRARMYPGLKVSRTIGDLIPH
jgi:serine/threonine protein phosphatase PrpC